MHPSAGDTGLAHGGAVRGFAAGWKIVLALLAIGGATFGLPYLIPVTPSVSLSYAAGFNNHAAFVFFFLGSFQFALLARGWMEDGQEDRDLPRRALSWALIVGFVVCVVRVALAVSKTASDEAPYFLNRQYLVSRGLVPYRQFEFVYGPLLLYPEAWIARMLHVSDTAGYSIWWVMSWLLGLWMLWELVRSVDIASRRRTHIFALICAVTLLQVPSRGLNYTPLRNFCAAFAVLMVHRACWRWRRPGGTSGAAVLAVALALSVSPEQGVGAAAGLALYFTYLAALRSSVFSWSALAMMLVGFAAIFAVAERMSMFLTMRSISSGAFNFPLLPSPAVCLVLGCYLCAACVLVERVRQGMSDSVTLPLVCAGVAMLPSAMGRCDVGHLESAWPAMLVGVSAIFGRASVGRWWVPMAWWLLVAPAAVLGAIGMIRPVREAAELALVGSGIDPTPVQRWVRASMGRNSATRQTLMRTSDAVRLRDRVNHPTVPCDRVYLVPMGGLPPGPCTDTGYFLGEIDVLLPAQIQSKIDELEAHPEAPLLLRGATPEASFSSRQDRMAWLYLLEETWFVPRERHTSLSLAPVAAYVSQHYTRVGTLENGMTVWTPKVGTPAAGAATNPLP